MLTISPLFSKDIFVWGGRKRPSRSQVKIVENPWGGYTKPFLAFREVPSLKLTYCWWRKSCTTKDDDYPIIYRVLTIPGGAGFCPSTVASENGRLEDYFPFEKASWQGLWYVSFREGVYNHQIPQFLFSGLDLMFFLLVRRFVAMEKFLLWPAFVGKWKWIAIIACQFLLP